MTQEQIAAEVKSIGDNLTQVLANSANAKADAIEAKSVVNELKSKLDSVVSAADLAEFKSAMQDQFDALATKAKESAQSAKTFDQVFLEKLESMDIEKEVMRKGRILIEMPEVKTMTLSANLSGDPVATYNSRQAINPAQLVRAQDS